MSHAESLTGPSSLQRPQSSSTHQGLPPTRFPAEVGGWQRALPGVEPRVPPLIMTQHIHAHTHTHMLRPPPYNLVPTHPHNATSYSRHTPRSYVYPCTLLYTYSGSLPYTHLHPPPPHPHAQVSTFTLYSTRSLQLNIPPPPIHTLIPPPQSLYPHPSHTNTLLYIHPYIHPHPQLPLTHPVLTPRPQTA